MAVLAFCRMVRLWRRSFATGGARIVRWRRRMELQVGKVHAAHRLEVERMPNRRDGSALLTSPRLCCR